MILSNVNIGTGPSTGDGDPLRTAFNVINQNFAEISANVDVLTQGLGVRTVAGRQGNVLLTVNDIIGISNYPNASTVGTWITSNVASLVDSAPDALNTLNEIAAALNDDANVYTTLTGTITTANTAMKGYVDGQVSSLTSNAAVQAGQIVDANTAMKGYVDGQVTSLTANAAVQAGLIADNASAVTTANTAMKGYVDSEISTVNGNITTANTAMKGYVDSVANLTYYGNANVASYLPTYSGNIKVDTITFEDLSEQTTAYTGQQFRTDLSGNGLTSKPPFLAYNPGYGDKPTIDTHFGFDSGGMWFTGNANDQRAFPIRTNFHFHDTDVVEVTATIYFDTSGDDHGMAVFPVNTNPYWKFSTFAGRIQFNYNVGIPQLWGTANSSVAGSSVLSADNYYTFKFTYDPTQSSVTAETFSGNTAVGSPLDTRTITENLNAKEFVVGFDADQDNLANKSYFKGLTIKTLTNGVFNDLEVTNDLTVDGNLSVAGYVVGNLTVDGDVTGDNLNIANWDTAYTWGNHASAGYAVNVAVQGWTTNEINTANSAVVGYVDDAVSTANIALKGYADATFLTSTLGANLNANSYDITGWNNLTGQSGGTVSGFTTLTGDSGGTISQFLNLTGDSGGTISQFTNITGDSGGTISQFTNITGDGGGSITGFDIDWTLIQNTPTTISGYGITDAYGDSNVAAYTGNISAQVNGYDIGYRDIPQVTAGNVTLTLADSGKHYYATSAAPLTLTVPSNANVAFPIGTAISIVNKGSANLTVALEAEASMYLAGNATSASRTITTYGMATLMKTATDEWFINGTGVA